MLFFIIHTQRLYFVQQKEKKNELNKGFFSKESWHEKLCRWLLMLCNHPLEKKSRKVLGRVHRCGISPYLLTWLSLRDGIFVENKTGNMKQIRPFRTHENGQARRMACTKCRKRVHLSLTLLMNCSRTLHPWRRISSHSVKVAVCMGYVPSNCPVAT